MILLIFWGFLSQAVQLDVSGDKNQAKINFDFLGKALKDSTYRLEGNSIEISFPGVTLTEDELGQLSSMGPHPLIHRIVSFQSEKNLAKARVILNGSVENLSNRLHLQRSGNVLSVQIDYPDKVSALQFEESLPLKLDAKKEKKEAAVNPTKLLITFGLFILTMGGAGFVYYRRANKSRPKAGSRKFLIENLSYCAITPKSGVSLIKVGQEFVLLGVTPENITMLSSLPKLQGQYEEEAILERDVFRHVVKNELDRVNIQSV